MERPEDRQIYRQTEGQLGGWTARQTDGHTARRTDDLAVGWTDRQTNRD